MGTQKIQTQNGNTREKLVQDAKKEAHAAGGNLAEAVIKFVERTADQLRYEDIQALDKKTEDAKKQITTLTAAHSALSKRQEEVESSQKTVVKTCKPNMVRRWINSGKVWEVYRMVSVYSEKTRARRTKKSKRLQMNLIGN